MGYQRLPLDTEFMHGALVWEIIEGCQTWGNDIWIKYPYHNVLVARNACRICVARETSISIKSFVTGETVSVVSVRFRPYQDCCDRVVKRIWALEMSCQSCSGDDLPASLPKRWRMTARGWKY